jgi:hypothetical protein
MSAKSSISGGRSTPQRLGLLVLQRPDRRFNRLAKASQHLGIESVSLGQPSGRAGKLSDLSGIDHRDRYSSGRQRAGHWHFQTAGGFEDYQVGSRGEPFEQLSDSLLIVGNREGPLIGTRATSNCALDTSIPTNRFTSAITVPPHAACPALRSGIFVPYNRSGLSVVGARRPSLLDGVSSPRMHRPFAPRPLMTPYRTMESHVRLFGLDAFEESDPAGC